MICMVSTNHSDASSLASNAWKEIQAFGKFFIQFDDAISKAQTDIRSNTNAPKSKYAHCNVDIF